MGLHDIWHAYPPAMPYLVRFRVGGRSLPIASFRPCRYQQRPCNLDCLPPGRGDACFFQQTGWTRHAGQTKRPEACLASGSVFSYRGLLYRAIIVYFWPLPLQGLEKVDFVFELTLESMCQAYKAPKRQLLHVHTQGRGPARY